MPDQSGPDLSAATRRGPLDGRRAGSGTVSLTPVAPASRLSLRARGAAVNALSEALGLVLPETPKTAASEGSRHALWLGPDEWLVIDENPAADLAGAAVRSGVLHSAVDVSHRNTAIHVEGLGAEAALSAGCPQDLALDAFVVGACSRTLLGKAEAIIWRRSEVAFQVECWRSYADYVLGFLALAAGDAAV